jgi:hypothetical protein
MVCRDAPRSGIIHVHPQVPPLTLMIPNVTKESVHVHPSENCWQVRRHATVHVGFGNPGKRPPALTTTQVQAIRGLPLDAAGLRRHCRTTRTPMGMTFPFISDYGIALPPSSH